MGALQVLGDMLRKAAWQFARDPQARKAAVEARIRFWLTRASVLRIRASQVAGRRKKRLMRREARAEARAAALSEYLDRLCAHDK